MKKSEEKKEDMMEMMAEIKNQPIKIERIRIKARKMSNLFKEISTMSDKEISSVLLTELIDEIEREYENFKNRIQKRERTGFSPEQIYKFT